MKERLTIVALVVFGLPTLFVVYVLGIVAGITCVLDFPIWLFTGKTYFHTWVKKFHNLIGFYDF